MTLSASDQRRRLQLQNSPEALALEIKNAVRDRWVLCLEQV